MSRKAAAAHTSHQTSFTRTGRLDMSNKKPFRTARQKEMAKSDAQRCDDGAYRSSAPVSYHKTKRPN